MKLFIIVFFIIWGIVIFLGFGIISIPSEEAIIENLNKCLISVLKGHYIISMNYLKAAIKASNSLKNKKLSNTIYNDLIEINNHLKAGSLSTKENIKKTANKIVPIMANINDKLGLSKKKEDIGV